jgi:predicted RecB family nuclease
MRNTITSEILVAYSQCSRKAFLLLCTDEPGIPHEYMRILEQQKRRNQINYMHALEQPSLEEKSHPVTDLNNEGDLVTKATLKTEALEAYCDVLTQVESSSSSGGSTYEPTIVVGTYSLSKERELELAFTGLVLGQMQGKLPVAGHIVKMGGQSEELKLEPYYKVLKSFLDPLRAWLGAAPTDPPPIVLNKHCPSCQFRALCREKAEKEDDLSLLDRVTPKIMRRYHKKGIFTVTQLSYLYKPRRSRKQSKKTTTPHKLELQALAVRTNKIYIQELPVLSRHSIELFLDIEGIPDQHRYYLFGLLVYDNSDCSYYPFWGDTAQDEERIWHQFLEKVNEYPEAPIYHYGTYEPGAIEKLATRYQTDCGHIKQHMINVLAFIYGKVYFPVRSNSLKDIGRFIGASWTSPDASGLQTLVWRHRWEETQHTEYKQLLMTYNQEDCLALLTLTNELTKIGSTADSQPNIDFADHPKQLATPIGEQIHSRFEAILKFAHADYDGKKIRIRQDGTEESTSSKEQIRYVSHQGYTIPRATRVIHIPQTGTCPHCGGIPLQASATMAERTIVDLVFSKNGCRKTVTKYLRPKGYCQNCQQYYSPESSDDFPTFHLYGRGLQAWVVYQRLVLRLPYRLITQATEDLFHVHISGAHIVNFLNDFAHYYADTERLLIERILASPFVHVDETTINIRGVDHYVWVFTDGTHMIFRMTETREATIVHDFLSGYQGILISDFYPGYDSVKCRQQKCLVHLIRDLNEDLWKSPFDGEFEAFILEVKNLIVPMLEAVQKYGLKKRHLQKFSKQIDQFYERVITDRTYHSDLTIKYQSRFKRYRQSLFTFIEQDGIPWNNNMAERAIRHLAVQRKISGFFFKSVAPQYLLMLGITQTCRFQEKSLLKFLMSGEKDIDLFKATKSLKRSTPLTPLSRLKEPEDN